MFLQFAVFYELTKSNKRIGIFFKVIKIEQLSFKKKKIENDNIKS